MSFKPSDKVVLHDDQGWLIRDRGQRLVKGRTYTVRDLHYFGSVLAISVMEAHEENYYRACRFKKPCTVQQPSRLRAEQPEPALQG